MIRAIIVRLEEPPDVLVRIPGKRPGERVGVVRWYEAGYYTTSADREDWTTAEVDTFVIQRNLLNGISVEVAESALDGSMFGWHVPAATPAIQWFKEFRLRGN
jgi:hypothetical protein